MTSAENLFRNDRPEPSEARQLAERSLLPMYEGYSQRAISLPAEIELEVIEMFHRHTAALSRYAATLTRDREMVQDAIQETFLRYFTTRSGGHMVENPRAWLFRVLRNYLVDRNRKSSSIAAVDLDAAGQLADLTQDVEARYEKREISLRALSSLSPREQECMRLRLEGLGYDEIAHVLQIRPGTVGALLTRGLKKIREADLLPQRH